MDRLPGYLEKGIPQPIILRGNSREPVFGNDEDCQCFKEALQGAAAMTAATRINRNPVTRSI